MMAVAEASQEGLKQRLNVNGGSSLSGTLRVSGAKNSALVLMTASLLSQDIVELTNIPSLTDIDGMSAILESLGVQVDRGSDRIRLTAAELSGSAPPYELVNSLRASFFSIGPLLGRLGHARVPLPGGCRIGARPVVEHIRGLKALGAIVNVEHGIVTASVPGSKKRLTGAQIVLDCPSVGATETILMAAVLAEGVSTIENAAQEPEVQDLANLLNTMGARVTGAGGPVITVEGVEQLQGCSNYPVIPDRIEAGTFLMAAAITRSKLVVEPVIPEHLSAVIQKLRDCGCTIDINGRSVTVTPGEITAVDITTQPFPGFPTDLQAPFMALMCTAKGTSVISEKIYENRLQHVAELQRMGASIRLKGSTAIVEGVAQLSGAPVTGTDLRAAAAMVLAGLSAKGITEVAGLKHLDRGYDDLESKLSAVGAEVKRNIP
ncbi:UDP-N-acetylglucosamine 1-carboxyvinyltransferase [Synechococcus sp. PROS-U-1]|uniref:UDP-N-acetylglucosamine 1-carboxyvinyltransferase n=1 Tax=Synechococcus sp. PROS-U-1 TaxID=1400866 RepID=UPI0016442071|nr:UDP-N-acetylglucosamine 1-carboxyvinyltransferase [Synechococcus sp. PROS-U-1]QNJ02643.1 UDP-N-acetylglucosamine 1-carboxyvinyltransferase [Synechococcus sp. PROS-U-1]